MSKQRPHSLLGGRAGSPKASSVDFKRALSILVQQMSFVLPMHHDNNRDQAEQGKNEGDIVPLGHHNPLRKGGRP